MSFAPDIEEDEQLRLAIELSLQDAVVSADSGQSQKAPHMLREVVDLSNDDPPAQYPAVHTLKDKVAPVLPERSIGMLGLNRRAMEVERLARKRKRDGSISSPLPRDLSRLKVNQRLPVQQNDANIISAAPEKSKGTNATSSNTFKSSTNQGVKYPQGKVFKTWAYGFPREDDIKIEELLQAQDLSLAIVSSFQWDFDWLLQKVNIASTKLTMVMQAKDDATKRQYRQETVGMANLRLCFPSMEGQINCMHAKIMLLSHPSHLRIAIPTANLVPYDWGETGIMENMVFVIDLPRLANGERTPVDRMTPFGEELVYFLRALGLQEEITSSIYNFDFSATRDFAFVHTIGGVHTGIGDSWRRTGYCGLGRAISKMGLNTKADIQVDFVASSIGAVTLDFLSTLYLAAQGDDGLEEYSWRVNTSKKVEGKRINAASKQASQQARNKIIEKVRNNFRIYFPTQRTVERSRGGINNGGTICFNSRWFNAPTFPKEVLRDCISRRDGLLMHNKVILSAL